MIRSDKLRILVINYEYPPIGGGGGFVTRDILEAMAARGHMVTIVTSRFNELDKHEIRNGVEIVRVPICGRKDIEVASMASMLSYVPSGLIQTLGLKKLRSFQLINTHFAIPSGPLGFSLGKIIGIPNVLTIHGGDIFDPSKSLSPHRIPLLSRVVRYLLNHADRVVAQSRDTRRNAYKYHRATCPIDIIPLGIKRPVYSKAKRSDFGLKEDQIVFSTIGRLVSRKNLDDSLKIMAALKSKIDFRFMIMGHGPMYKPLQKKIHELDLDRHVQLMGNVSDEVKFQVLDLSDMYISTALHEGFGLVFLEAMACSLPVISYNRGGHTDFLQDQVTGFLVELGNTKDFTHKLMLLAGNKALRHELGNYNKDLVEHYYIETCADNYIRLFHSAIDAKIALRN
jgi:glycosyltransferase involved in cell wall biosynthesis